MGLKNTIATRISSISNFLNTYRKNKAAAVGLLIFCTLALAGLLAPFIAPFGPFELAGIPFLPPSFSYLLGTDDFGRDIFSQILYGINASLAVGFLSAVISAVIGIAVGSISGFFSGRIDLGLNSVTEVFQVIPTFVFALAVLALFGPSFLNVIVAIAIVSWPANARLVRSQILSIKEQPFVLAAKAIGMGRLRIIFSEILPNVAAPLIVNTMLQVGGAIAAETGLGFLGLSDPRMMSWGWMLGNSRPYLLMAWWMMTFPGLSVLLTVLSLHFVADGLNQALNPRQREAEK